VTSKAGRKAKGHVSGVSQETHHGASYEPAELEWLAAVTGFQAKHKIRFLAHTHYLKIARELGYTQTPPPTEPMPETLQPPEMTIKAAAPWYGSKRSIGPAIVEAIGPHSASYDLFCGGLGWLFAKPRCRFEVVNDWHGDMINLARVIASPELAPEFHERLLHTLPHEDIYRGAAATIRNEKHKRDTIDLERALTFFQYSWLGINGVGGTTNPRAQYARRYTSGGGDPATRFASAVNSIPAWHERLRRVSIYSMCGIELATKIEDKLGTVIYCDPPYIAKSDKYLHDFASADHQRLAAALQRYRRTRVYVSYYDHPEIDRLYPPGQWRKIDLTTTKNLGRGTTGGKPANVAIAPEILLTNAKE
jgi:DNA adenine methylase